MPVPARRGPMQIWVTQSGTAVVFRSRSARRMAGLRDRLLTEWSYAEHHRGSYSCAWGVLEVAPVDVETTEDYGGKGIRRGFKLAVMKDGALAVGIQTVVYGRTGSLLGWGDVHRGSIPLPNRTIWSWSKLARIGPGDKEPDPVDADSLPSGARSLGLPGAQPGVPLRQKFLAGRVEHLGCRTRTLELGAPVPLIEVCIAPGEALRHRDAVDLALIALRQRA
jgi:hypothetical protein